MQKIAQGAEAVIMHDGAANAVIKDRVAKTYRHPAIDTSLRKFRTRREGKVLDKLNAIGFPAPKVLEVCDKKMQIKMEFVKGEKLRDVLDDDPITFSAEIGEMIALLHSNDIIHGDLTTSNMILDDKKKINFIDFGLSFFSTKIEDKAVDLHLLRQALESKHHTICKECFNAALDSYWKRYSGGSLVIKRLEEVEKRGRNKH